MKPFVVGFNQGQYGDLFIGLTACSVIKSIWPSSTMIYSVNKKYTDVIPILRLSPYIDKFIIWEGYEDWPLPLDSANLGKLLELEKKAGENSFQFFQPMEKHTVADWYNYWHQTAESCVMHSLPRPTKEQENFKLPKPEVEQEETITICTGRRKNKEGEYNTKAVTLEQIETVKGFCEENNLKLIQIKGGEEDLIEGVEHFEGNYSESVIKVLQSKILVSCDTGMIWASSALSHPTIGLYDLSFYPDAATHLNWVPKNENQVTIFSKEIKNIGLHKLEECLSDMYNTSK